MALIFATVAAGLAIRFVHVGLPPLVMKYGGSMLWALTMYWIVSTLLPSCRIVTAALVSAVLAAAVELFKLYHSPGMDAFRHTTPGILLLGRIFSGWDIAAYWLAIVAGAFADRRIRATSKP